MTTIFLKFPDRATAEALLPDFRIADDRGIVQWRTNSPVGVIDVIGTFRKANEDGTTTTVPGFHVNFAGQLPDALLPYAINPATPERVFA